MGGGNFEEYLWGVSFQISIVQSQKVQKNNKIWILSIFELGHRPLELHIREWTCEILALLIYLYNCAILLVTKFFCMAPRTFEPRSMEYTSLIVLVYLHFRTCYWIFVCLYLWTGYWLSLYGAKNLWSCIVGSVLGALQATALQTLLGEAEVGKLQSGAGLVRSVEQVLRLQVPGWS